MDLLCGREVIKMGNCIRIITNRLWCKNINKKNIVLMIVGLDNAGKTSVLNHISNDPDRDVMPTMGFRVITVRHKLYSIKIYDLGGIKQIRSIWKKYYQDIHGVIYVVDASDIFRLTENKIVFGELISHENIAGKPILLLANKQDVPTAIDELDLVENLDIEHVANAMRSPTRVEICSCLHKQENSKQSTIGIINGFKWLLETISKNYSILENRIRISQSLLPHVNSNIQRRWSTTSSLTPSRSSIRSNPFKPIRELISNTSTKHSADSTHVKKNTKSLTSRIQKKNKTGPTSLEQSGDITVLSGSTIEIESFHQNDTDDRISLVRLNPSNLDSDYHANHSQNRTRPFTAPALFVDHRSEMFTTFSIPGQVPL